MKATIIMKECRYGDGTSALRGWLLQFGGETFLAQHWEARERGGYNMLSDGTAVATSIVIPAATWVYSAKGAGDLWNPAESAPVAGGPGMTFERAVADLERKGL